MMLHIRDHNEHAGRFMDLCVALDACLQSQQVLNMNALLVGFVNSRLTLNMLNRSGGNCSVADVTNDGRYQLPANILTWIFEHQVTLNLPYMVTLGRGIQSLSDLDLLLLSRELPRHHNLRMGVFPVQS